MAFIESDRVALRHFLGFSAIFLQADSRLESAISSVQSIADGGTRPTNDTELAIKAMVVNLFALEKQMMCLWAQASVSKADEITIDAYRGRQMLCAEGRRLVRGLEVALATRRRGDVFGQGHSHPNGDAFDAFTAGPNW